MNTRKGDYIETYTGNVFYPIDPRPEEIHLEDIAHGLSLMCRFNGQCKRMFSVAQHSLNVMREVAYMTHDWSKYLSIKAQALALLHDSSETLGIADVCSPAKKHMPEYQEIESRIMDAVWSRFDLLHNEEEYRVVDIVDKAMAAYEARELMRCVNWDLSYSYLTYCDPNFKKYIVLETRNPEDVEREFLSEANRLLSYLSNHKQNNEIKLSSDGGKTFVLNNEWVVGVDLAKEDMMHGKIEIST